MIYTQKPKDFHPKFEVTSCFCEYRGEILLLLRQDNKPQDNTWGVPAGKIDDNESLVDATIREIKEETGIIVTSEKLEYVKKVYIKYPEFSFVYHMFKTEFSVKPEVLIAQKEHKDFVWITPEKALKLNLIEDLDNCIKMVYLSS